MSVPQKPDLLNNLITEKEFCKKLSISYASAYNLRAKGKISFYRIMGKVYFSQDQIEEYLRSCERRAQKTKPLSKEQIEEYLSTCEVRANKSNVKSDQTKKKAKAKSK